MLPFGRITPTRLASAVTAAWIGFMPTLIWCWVKSLPRTQLGEKSPYLAAYRSSSARPSCLRQLADVDVAAVDELAAVLADLAVGEAVRSPAAPAQSLAGLVQVGVHAHLVQLVGRGDARQTRAHDHDPGVARRSRGRAGVGRTRPVGRQHRSGAERTAGGDQLPSRKPCDGLLELHRRFTRLLPQDCLGVLLDRPRDPRPAAPMRPSPFLGIVSCAHTTHPPPMH